MNERDSLTPEVQLKCAICNHWEEGEGLIGTSPLSQYGGPVHSDGMNCKKHFERRIVELESRLKDWKDAALSSGDWVSLETGKTVRPSTTETKAPQDEKPPCGCITRYKGSWIQDCDCGNGGDLAQSAEWCAVENYKAQQPQPPTTANPSDCICEHMHRSFHGCPSKAPSRGAIADGKLSNIDLDALIRSFEANPGALFSPQVVMCLQELWRFRHAVEPETTQSKEIDL